MTLFSEVCVEVNATYNKRAKNITVCLVVKIADCL